MSTGGTVSAGGGQVAGRDADSPVVTVVSGSPCPEELAVVLTLVSAGGGQAAGQPPADGGAGTPGGRGTWSDAAARLRRPHLPGPGAWRTWAR